MGATIPHSQPIHKKFKRFLTSLSLYFASLSLTFLIGFQIGNDKQLLKQVPSEPVKVIEHNISQGILLPEYGAMQASMEHVTQSGLNETLSDDLAIKNSETQQGTEYTKQIVITTKTGSVYYYPWCSGLDRIKPENKIYLENEQLALDNGLTRAKNCDSIN